jgi:hypothetical protein
VNDWIAKYIQALKRTLRLLEPSRRKYAGHKRIPAEHVSLSGVVARLEGAVVSAISKKWLPAGEDKRSAVRKTLPDGR